MLWLSDSNLFASYRRYWEFLSQVGGLSSNQSILESHLSRRKPTEQRKKTQIPRSQRKRRVFDPIIMFQISVNFPPTVAKRFVACFDRIIGREMASVGPCEILVHAHTPIDLSLSLWPVNTVELTAPAPCVKLPQGPQPWPSVRRCTCHRRGNYQTESSLPGPRLMARGPWLKPRCALRFASAQINANFNSFYCSFSCFCCRYCWWFGYHRLTALEVYRKVTCITTIMALINK